MYAANMARKYYSEDAFDHAVRAANYVSDNELIPQRFRKQCIALALMPYIIKQKLRQYRIEYCGTSQKKNRCVEGHICYTKKELTTVWKRLFSTYKGTWCTIYDKGGTVIFSGCVDSSGYNAIRKL